MTPELTSLLDAQREATEDLPYDLLGVRKPKLVQVYVRQAVRGQSEDESSPVERVMSVDEALNTHDHLVITGEPGAGKSTVGHFYVKDICDSWREGLPNPLRERVLPLRVSARSLAVAESWSAALASGARDALSTLLDVTPTPELFAARQEGVRWLVFVDGLDEIADTATRTQVARSIARQVRRGVDYRIVVTTRQPADASLNPLHEAGLAFCGIQPFGREELVEFAQAWFRAQDPRTATERAADFVRQTSDGQLRELVRNPLLATIAAITHTRAPDRPLPANRVDLYDGFVKALLDGGGRNVRAELRRVLADHPARLELARWLADHRGALIRHLAVRRLESEEGLFDHAREWLGARRPDPPEGWEDDLRVVLDDSGLFVRTGVDWKFLHHSFAEFLAAREHASRIPADFPDLERWVERGLSEDDRAFTLFTLVLWGREHGLEQVVRRLLHGEAPRVELAALLLAEGGAVPDDLAAEVVDRALGLVLVGREGTGALLAALDVPEHVVSALHELVDRPEVALGTRIECAVALGGLVDARFGAARLEALTDVAAVDDLPRLVGGVAALVPDGDRLERLLLRVAARDEAAFLVVLELLLDHRRTEAAARLVRDAAGASRTAEDEATFAGLAVRARCPEEASRAARRALADVRADFVDFAVATQALLAAGGASDEVVAACDGRPHRHVLWAARRVVPFDPAAAGALARRLLLTGAEVGAAASVLLQVEGARAVHQVKDVLDRDGRRAEDLLQVAEHFDAYQQPEDAVVLAAGVLGDPESDQWDFAGAAKVLLRNGAESVDAVLAAAEGRSEAHRRMLAAALGELGHGAHAAELVRGLLRSPRFDVSEMGGPIAILLAAGERAAAEEVLAAGEARVDRGESSDLTALARAHALLGNREAAFAFARDALSVGGRDAVECWLDLGGDVGAVVAEVLGSVADADDRLTVAQECADRGLHRQAVELWRDVLVRPEEEQALDAARKLVGCGRRSVAIESLRSALAPDPPHRNRLRALLGWVVLSSPDADAQELLTHLRP